MSEKKLTLTLHMFLSANKPWGSRVEFLATSNALFCTARNPSHDDLSLEGSENGQAELDWSSVSQSITGRLHGGPVGGYTIHIDETVAVSDESVRDFQKIVHTDA